VRDGDAVKIQWAAELVDELVEEASCGAGGDWGSSVCFNKSC
jgi:hypothetical protein